MNRSLSFLFTWLMSAYLLSSPILADNLNTNVQTDFRQVAKKAIPTVVSIKVSFPAKKNLSPFGEREDFQDEFLKRFFGLPQRTETQEEPVQGQASGFIVSEDGYILTNSHVVNKASEVKVVLQDEREFPATVVGIDSGTDLALLKIPAKNLPFLKLGNSDAIEVGQWVVAIGNPFGLQASLTVGVVSATGRNNLDLASIEDFIQTDAAINRGNSGGPLLEMNGEVVGINTAIVTNMATGGYVGVGFAIPSNIVKHVMQQLIETGTVIRGFLGVSLQQMSPDLAAAFSLEKSEGALIALVAQGSPAEKAGLRQGDLILKLNKNPVRNLGALKTAVALLTPGSEAVLTLLRNGKMLEVPVLIGTSPTEGEAVKLEDNVLGFEVQTLTPELSDQLKLNGVTGVVVTKVLPHSPASLIGLKKGAVILEVNQKKVSSNLEFQAALKEVKKDKPILFLIKQGEVTQFISFKL